MGSGPSSFPLPDQLGLLWCPHFHPASPDSRDGEIPSAFPLVGFSSATLWDHHVPTAAFPTVAASGNLSFPPIFAKHI